MTVCRLERYESLDYREAEALQSERVAERKAGGDDRLIVLEHPPVITLGRAAGLEHLKGEPPIPIVRTGRGGQITYHGPGQLVLYPILQLEEERRDLHRYLRDLEQLVMDVCQDYQVAAERSPGRTGVWVGERKLASIGVRASAWVTSHGLACNYAGDLSGFAWMDPCGLEGVRMTSLELELGRPVARLELEERFRRHFGRIFHREVIG